MKYLVLGTGILGAVLFIYSIYVFWVKPENFKMVAYGFLGLAIIFFILVIIRKLREDRENRTKLKKKVGDR